MHPSLQNRVRRIDVCTHHGGARRLPITMGILHATEGGSARSSIDYLNTTTEKVASYNYLIDRNGDILRMCPPSLVAYHAGDSAWPNPKRATSDNDKPNGGHSVNGISVGVAFANNHEDVTDAALESALWLCDYLSEINGFPLELWRGHYEVSPGRKEDPLPGMDMDRFRILLTSYRDSQ